MLVLTTSLYTLTDAIRQVEAALDRGERLSDVVSLVSRGCAIDRGLLTRRWVQFTAVGVPPLGVATPKSSGAGRTMVGGK